MIALAGKIAKGAVSFIENQKYVLLSTDKFILLFYSL
jgi:hypothetical protein